MYVQINENNYTSGYTNSLHTISIPQQRINQSVQYPGQQPNGSSYRCHAIAYSNKQQQLYSYLTDDGGDVPLAVQAVDPLTGNNRTLVTASSLNVTWHSENAWDEETSSWFNTDLFTNVYHLFQLTPTNGSVVVTRRQSDAHGFIMWKAAYANAPTSPTTALPVVDSFRSFVRTRLMDRVHALRRGD